MDTAYHYSVSLNRTQTIIHDKILNQQDIAFIFGLNKSLKNLFENDSFYKLSLDKQKELGSCLFTIWFGDHWKTLLETLPPTDLIRITIASQDSDILNLPWELMTPDDSDPLGTDTKFSIKKVPGNIIVLMSFVTCYGKYIVVHLSHNPQSRLLLRPVLKQSPDLPGQYRKLLTGIIPEYHPVSRLTHPELLVS